MIVFAYILIEISQWFDFGCKHCWDILRKISLWAKLRNDSVKILKSLKWKRFTDTLGGQEDSNIKSDIAEPTSHNELPNWQPNTSPIQWPLGAKTKNDLASIRTNEQVAHVQTQASLEMARILEDTTKQFFVSILMP